MNPRQTKPMMSLLSSNPILIMILMIGFTISTTNSDTPSYLRSWNCNTNTTTTSAYQKNLRTVFSFLVSNATREDGFYNATVGNTTSGSAVYGLLLCRGDVSTDTCQTCVQMAVEFMSKNCSRSKDAGVWYDECMVRFSDTGIFGQMDDSVSLALENTQNINGNMSQFEQVTDATMTELQSVAANGVSGKKFATKEALVGGSQPVYVMEQCTPDLSVSDCKRCLVESTQALISCCSGRQGARMLYPSCNVRYEIYPFYEPPAPAPSPSAVAPPVALPPSEPATKNATITPAGVWDDRQV